MACYNVVGYVVDGAVLCPQCMVHEYSGRVDRWHAPYRGSYDNRRAIVNGLHALMQERWEYERRYSVDRRGSRRWSEIVEDVLCFGDVHVYGHEGDTICPMSDAEETDYIQYCDTCGTEISTTVLCHIDDTTEVGDCQCDACRAAEALSSEDEAEIVLALRDALHQYWLYQVQECPDRWQVSALHDIRYNAARLSRIRYMARRPYRWLRGAVRAADRELAALDSY